MDYKDLKKVGLHYLENRKENKELKISEEDMRTLDTYRKDAFRMPLIIGASLFGIKILYDKLPIPSLLFDNPIEPEERRLWRKKFFSKFFGNQMLFIGTLAAAIWYTARYDIGKYYLFLKYENYVNAYVDARDAEIMKTLINRDSQQFQ